MKRAKDLYRRVRRLDRERKPKGMTRLEWRARRREVLAAIGARLSGKGK